jgi:hypothetical protein
MYVGDEKGIRGFRREQQQIENLEDLGVDGKTI